MEWFAVTPGPVGDHLAVSTTTVTFEAAAEQARQLTRTTGRPHRVVAIREVAVYGGRNQR